MQVMPVHGDAYPMGCDPEGFVFRNNKPIAITGMLGGKKGDPVVVGEHGGYQEDGVAFELNPTPTAHLDTLVNNTFRLLTTVRNKMKLQNITTKIVPYVEFDYNYEFPQECLVAGCSPDYDVYQMQENPAPVLGYVRSAGGHMTMQVPRSINLEKFVKTCDRVVGLYSIIKDKDPVRRKLYGKAGCFRAHILNDEWGLIEYRTPSNFWLKNKAVMHQAFSLFQQVPKYISKMEKWEDIYNEQYVVMAINRSNVSLAKEILNAQGINYV